MREVYEKQSAEFEEYRNSASRLELIFDRSEALFPLQEFAVKAVPEANALPRCRLFAQSLDRRLEDPIIENWYFELYQEEARERGINVTPLDDFEINPSEVEKTDWGKEAAQRFRGQKRVELSVLVPSPCDLYFHRRGQGVADAKPNLTRLETPGPAPTAYELEMQASGNRVEVTALDPPTLELSFKDFFFPKFKLLGFRLASSHPKIDF